VEIWWNPALATSDRAKTKRAGRSTATLARVSSLARALPPALTLVAHAVAASHGSPPAVARLAACRELQERPSHRIAYHHHVVSIIMRKRPRSEVLRKSRAPLFRMLGSRLP
jgi:hypothetical protein